MLDVYRKNLRDKLAEYYSCPEHTKKVQLRKDIADIVKQELTEQGIHICQQSVLPLAHMVSRCILTTLKRGLRHCYWQPAVWSQI